MENILAKRPPVALRMILIICSWMAATLVLISEFSQNFLQILYYTTRDISLGDTTPLYWLNSLVYCAAFIIFAIFVTVYFSNMKGRAFFAIFFALFAGTLLFSSTLNFFEYIIYSYMLDLYSLINLLWESTMAVLAIICMILVFCKKKVLSLSIAFTEVAVLYYLYKLIKSVFTIIVCICNMTYGDIYTYAVIQNALDAVSAISVFPMFVIFLIVVVFFDRAEQKPAAIETGSFLEGNE